MRVPSYINLLQTGEFENRVTEALQHLENCDCCANKCEVDRTHGEIGICRTGHLAEISSFGPHHGEENPLSGWRGSGTIFFTHCNLHCEYCQNYDISQISDGKLVDAHTLSKIMLYLQDIGCHNINLVSPSHVVPQILSALYVAAKRGLRLPIIYNTGGYDSLVMLYLLDGIIDIYMPDMKYSDESIAYNYSKIHNYPNVNQAAVREMHRQVGNLMIDEDGLAYRGLLVRHLILPNGLSGTKKIVQFLTDEISHDTYINLMDQYRPVYLSNRYHMLNRSITPNELNDAREMALEAGLHRLD